MEVPIFFASILKSELKIVMPGNADFLFALVEVPILGRRMMRRLAYLSDEDLWIKADLEALNLYNLC
jgi:hypothetical protein